MQWEGAFNECDGFAQQWNIARKDTVNQLRRWKGGGFVLAYLLQRIAIDGRGLGNALLHY